MSKIQLDLPTPLAPDLLDLPVAGRQAHGEPGAHPEADRILHLARVVARARVAGRAA